MKKNMIILLVFFISSSTISYGQVAIKNDNILALVNKTPQEETFVHYNASLLFAGEYLYYKIYTFNSDTKKLSDLSKIAYVELVGEGGERVFRQKISLKNGMGQGDFFIPTSVPSGNYKLLGYTQWMLNKGIKNTFRGDIVIINPYQVNQEGLTQVIKSKKDSLIIYNPQKHIPDNNFRENELLALSVNSNTFGKREQVVLSLQNLSGLEVLGYYSLSVRRIGKFQNPTKYTSEDYTSLYENINRNSRVENDSIYLPELRGDLITGKILLEEEAGNLPLADQNIAFAVPEDKILRIANTDKSGNFQFNIDNEYFGTSALVQVLGKNSSNYAIELENGPELDYFILEFGDYSISPEMEETILERSIHNQIQNSYFAVKSDTIKLPIAPDPFYGDLLISYNLDDFDRFKTVSTTFVEIIKSAWVTRNNEGELVFEVKDYQTNNNGFGAKTMLLVDGLLVQDHGDLVEYNANKIDEIGVVRNIYYYGPKAFHGIVTLETKEDDFYKTYRSDAIEQEALNPPEPIKSYYNQSYGPGENFKNHIPDFRSQLLWKPNIAFKTPEFTIDFFTSDIPGRYEIELEGFTTNGEPVSIRKVIRVE